MAVDLRQEIEHHSGIEVEHLGASELSVAELIKGQHRSVNPVSGGTDCPLSPEYYYLFLAGSHDARIHFSLSLARLQRVPRFDPAGTVGLQTA